uniref:hypothetical protein n=1 Tax=Ningiella ruwaisensis TaxID=2364274 RepID=UPI0010A07434|nr:hypothetical protein [Ningiella ruwaisensis]
MSLICTIFNSQHWEELCKVAEFPIVNKVESYTDENLTVLLKKVLSNEELAKLLAKRISVSLIVPPLHILFKSFSNSESLTSRVSTVESLLDSLLALYKKNRKYLRIYPMSTLFEKPETPTNESVSDSLPHISLDSLSIKQDFYDIICHSLVHQNPQLLKIFRKIESCFMVSEKQSVFFPQLEGMEEELINLHTGNQIFKEENARLLQQLHLVQEAIEVKVDTLNELKQEKSKVESEIENFRISGAKQNDLLKNCESCLFKERNKTKMLVAEKKAMVSAHEDEIQSLNKRFTDKIKEFETLLDKRLSDISALKSSHTMLEKKAAREIKNVENKLAAKLKIEHQLRAELAELRTIKQSKIWKVSSRMEKLSNIVDRDAKKRKQLIQDISLIYTSELFEADWYLATYKDVKESLIDPAEHYLIYGAKEGRRPSQHFDGNWYLKRYPDVAESKLNPLIHYIRRGRQEGRLISPVMITHNKKQ